MRHENVELHNVAEVTESEETGGVRLQRVPMADRDGLNKRAGHQMLRPIGTEIRFVSESPTVTVTLSCPKAGTCTVVPFWGPFMSPFQHDERVTVGAEPETIELTNPESRGRIDPDVAADLPFSPQVW